VVREDYVRLSDGRYALAMATPTGCGRTSAVGHSDDSNRTQYLPEVMFMSDPANVLVVAHQTATTEGLIAAVRERAARGSARFHLVVPRHAHGMHRVVDPQDADDEEAQAVLNQALPKLTEAAGRQVTGSIGDPEPLSAIHDAVNLSSYDEIIISTLPSRLSRWLKLDLVSKTRGLGLPVTHIEATSRSETPAAV
jgi:hypothetical protein